MDEPYTVSGAGRLVICNRGERDINGEEIPRVLVGGILLGDIKQDDYSGFELWDVEITMTVRRKYRGSPCRGGTMDTQLVQALNSPQNWEEKIFDTLAKPKRGKRVRQSR